MHPQDLPRAEWGVEEHASYCGVFQRDQEAQLDLSCSLPSPSKKPINQWYSEWDEGLPSLTRAVKEAKRLRTSQDIMVQGSSPLLNLILRVSPPSEGVAQKATEWKWSAYLEEVSQLLQVREGPIKVSRIQQPVDPDQVLLGQPYRPSVITEASALSVGLDTQGMLFADISACQTGSKWQYEAAALAISTRKRVTEEGDSSAQMGEL